MPSAHIRDGRIDGQSAQQRSDEQDASEEPGDASVRQDGAYDSEDVHSLMQRPEGLACWVSHVGHAMRTLSQPIWSPGKLTPRSETRVGGKERQHPPPGVLSRNG